MKHANTVAWGLILSIGIAVLGGMGAFVVSETFLTVVGLGMIVFGIWAAVILLKNAPK